MNHFQHMTATAQAARSLPVTTVRKDPPRGDVAFIGNALQDEPVFAQGGAR